MDAVLFQLLPLQRTRTWIIMVAITTTITTAITTSENSQQIQVSVAPVNAYEVISILNGKRLSIVEAVLHSSGQHISIFPVYLILWWLFC